MMNNKFDSLKIIIEEQYSNTTGIMVSHNGSIVYEAYFNDYKEDDSIHIASVTKSLISLLIGVAIDKGYIHSIDQNVLEFFPEYKLKRGEKTIQHITIRHLLTMTAPYKYKSEPYTKVYSSDDWTKAALDLLGGKKAIGEFNYSTIGTQILSGILKSATGTTVLDFATENLFNPLDIKTPHNKRLLNKEEHMTFLKGKYVSGWVIDPMGTNTAGWGLTLTLKDMMKIGQLCINKGNWHNKGLVSTDWLKVSTMKQSQCNNLSYGYLWWIIDDPICPGYAALGDGGNVIFVSSKHDLVVAITSSFMPRYKDRIELIHKYIMPLI